MSKAELTVVLLLAGAVLGAIEAVLVELWWKSLWRGSHLVVARRRQPHPASSAAVIRALTAATRDSAFTTLQFRELWPGSIAIREALWDRRPHLGYWPIFLASLRLDHGVSALAIRPNWALWPLLAGCLLALRCGGLLWLTAWLVLALVVWGGLVQGLRLRRLLVVAAAAPAGSPSGVEGLAPDRRRAG